jgi:small subunit ribosomal protein S16
MLAIKFKRIGKKHQPSFRIIVQEAREKVNGLNAEDIGWYSPVTKKFDIVKERALHWISKGAQPTDSVHNLLVTAGVLSGAKRPVHNVLKAGEAAKAPEAAAAPAEAVKAEAPKTEATKE